MADNLSTSPRSEGSPFTEVQHSVSPSESQISVLSTLSNDLSTFGDSGAAEALSDQTDTKTVTDTFHSAEEQPTKADVNVTQAIESVAPPAYFASDVPANTTATAADPPTPKLKTKEPVRFTPDTQDPAERSGPETKAPEETSDARSKVDVPEVEVNPNDTGDDPEKWSARYDISCLADGFASLYSKGCSAFTATRKRVGPWVSAAWTGTTNQFSTASKYVSSKYTSMGGPTAMESVKKGVSSIWTGITHAAAWTRDNVGPMISSGWTKGKDLYSRAPSISELWNDSPSILRASYQSAKDQLVSGYKVVHKATGSYWPAAAGTADGKRKAD